MMNLIRVALLIPVLLVRLLWHAFASREANDTTESLTPVLAFFHPYCNDGGGGERVLWSLMRVAQETYGEAYRYRLYHGDSDASSAAIMEKTRTRFGIELPRPIEFVLLTRRSWVEASMYPVLTMLGQALGAVVLGCDALLQTKGPFPEIMFDSMGFAFAYPIFRIFGRCKVLSYTHYPVISTDMLDRVLLRRPSHNNSNAIAKSATLSWAKSTYYRCFAWLYGAAGRWSELTMVNSSWTRNHIETIWKCSPDRLFVVYPAVDTAAVADFALSPRENMVVSIAQFRPEKDHALQMRAFAKFRQLSKSKLESPVLVMIGAVRNAGDRLIVDNVKALGEELGLKEDCDFIIAENVPYAELLDYFRRAKVGLHSMWNEHFGIGVVELLAAGVLTIAHDSGGPKTDILSADVDGAQIGFCASNVEEYATAMVEAFALTDIHMQARARVAMKKFSDEAFADTVSALLPLVCGQKKKKEKKK